LGYRVKTHIWACRKDRKKRQKSESAEPEVQLLPVLGPFYKTLGF
jgi:hypothetical protein